ncbi:MAG: cation transporter, partial [Succinivibrio dextrinosolvens]|nr:cation transporter [Succinivibrio dextrinosolvens]
MQNTQLEQYRKLVLLAGGASVITAVLFILIKFGVWMISSSTVIFASLTDSIFDLLASLVNLLALRFSLLPPDDEHRFGHHKSQSLASLAQAAFIGGSAVLLI